MIADMKNKPIPDMCVVLPCPTCKGSGGHVVACGDLLRLYREGEGKSLTSVAGALGISKSYLGEIERDKKSVRPPFVARFKAAVKRAQGDQRKAGA